MEPERTNKNHKLPVRVVGALKRGAAIFSFMPICAKHVSQGLDLSHHRVPTINTLPIVIVTTYLLLVSVTVDMFTQLMLTGHNSLTERTWISLICAITMCVQSVDQCITVIFKPENYNGSIICARKRIIILYLNTQAAFKQLFYKLKSRTRFEVGFVPK